MKSGFGGGVVLLLASTVLIPRGWAGYYPPTFGGYNIDTLTSGSRTNFGLTLGIEYSRDTSGFPSIKADAFIQSGGTHNIEGPLTVEGRVVLSGVGGRAHTHFYRPYYRLRGGHLNCHDMTVTTASFFQSGGTNQVQGGLVVDSRGYESTTSYGLSGGRLITSNVVIQRDGVFGQRGGVQVVRNLLTVHGSRYGPSYYFEGGKFFVRDILLTEGAIFAHTSRGVIRHSGTLTLAGGRWSAAHGLTELGVLQLRSSTGPSAIALSRFAPSALRFAASADIAWATNALLVIYYWQAEKNGRPLHRIYFGTDKAGLTSEQAAQIHFRNPFGYPPGDYPGRIRRGGEIVPGI